MTQHKWHKEIKAWADGAEIQFRKLKWLEGFDNLWVDTLVPIWDTDDLEYRIKPQPKEPQYLYVYRDIHPEDVYFTCNNNTQCSDGLKYIGKIKLEDAK